MTSYDVTSYKDRLLSMRARLTHDVDAAEAALREGMQAPGELSHVPTHPADHDSEGLDSQVAIAENEAHMLQDVEEALARIEEGTFGRCEDCSATISLERLDAIPYTPWCIDCAETHSHELETPRV